MIAGNQRREIVISVNDIKKKLPEMGQSQDHGEAPGIIKLATGDMQFALVTSKGKKMNVHKIALSGESTVVKST